MRLRAAARRYTSRYDAYSKALNDGWMSVDEVRAKENLNPVPDGKGKGYREPLNMKPLGDKTPEPAKPSIKAA
jgi:hypothetical protein